MGDDKIVKREEEYWGAACAALTQWADWKAKQLPLHTDIYLGDDGRGSAFWKIICSGRVQEVNAPLPRDWKCGFCGQPVRPTTSVIGVDPKDLVEDTSGVVIEPFTKETIRRVTRGE